MNETNDPSAISIVTIDGDIAALLRVPRYIFVALPPAKWFPDVNWQIA